MSNQTSNWQVAPHGIICFAVFALLVTILIWFTGFRIVGAVGVKVGR